MTKQQIIDYLVTKYSQVEIDDTKWVSIPGMPLYLGYELFGIPVLEQNEDVMWENRILVWKKDADYYWKNGEPKSTGFPDRITTFIDSKITDGTVKFATLKDINQNNKKATVTAIMPDKSTKMVLLTETSVGVFSLEVIA